MNAEVINKIKIGISSCLMGEKVRFDSGHKKNSYVTDTLSDYFEFTPFCPEVSIGLGIPRETIRLVTVDDDIRCVGTKSPDLDVTEELYQCAEEQKDWIAELSGYILKKDSPSCGMERVKVYKGIEKGQMAEKSGATLKEIVAAIFNVSTKIEEINNALSEQSQSITQVNQSVNDMDTLTQENAALVEEASAASQEMANKTKSMVQEVEFFRL